MVNYTCTVTEAVSVSWTATPNLTDATFARFFANSPDLRMVACSDASSPVQCATLDFQASLTSVGDVTSGTANMTSMFRLTATAALNETVVQCRSSTLTVPETASETLIVESKCFYSFSKSCETWYHRISNNSYILLIRTPPFSGKRC